MDCNRIQDRLVDYLSEDTRTTEQLCVQVHLATCYHCREAYKDTRAVLDSAKEAIRCPGPERSFESAMNEIRTHEALLAFTAADTRENATRWSWGMVAAVIPIVVACVTPFVVAWPIAPLSCPADDSRPARIDTHTSAGAAGGENAATSFPVESELAHAIP